ncbi:hypothetical protein BDM02DRAFT_197686 [Thelephora ganbajun]|uniref:Uncharacterized protein n=1 Tax=Thelephora ganbajun TaxID=370292 RepID=A0ACB6ZRV3_THEGA|nr:hypothetical protein BDM02DRAFT_197686 [Thelephora ganbajun]
MPHYSSNSISYPTPIDIPSHKRQTSVKSHKSKQSSLSGTMSWLSGNKTTKAPYTAASPPLRISEPKLNDVFGRVEQAPSVTIVRTPQEALTFLQKDKEKVREDSFEYIDPRPKRSPTQRSQTDGYFSRNPCPSPPTSPPLPPLPDLSRVSPRSPSKPVMRPPPQVPLPQVPQPMPSPPRTVKASYSASLNEYSIGPLVETAPPSPPLPPFDPILLSTIPSLPIDPKKTIITLETSTESFKTTMATLISREDCYFNKYFSKTLMEARKNQHSEASSVYSQSSGIEENLDSINSIFANHISASGLLAPTPAALHVFLDRPSAPYTHILTYLRTPTSPDQPGVLPRAVKLSHKCLPAKTETLLELRDEANFLNLEELSRLCTEELSKYTPATSSLKSTTSSSVRSSKRPSITHAQSHHQLGMRSKNLSTHSIHQFAEDPNETEFDTHIPTPNSSAPSSREGSRHEATATPTPAPCLSQLRGHGKSHSNVHPLPPSKSITELRSDLSMTVKARPSPAWL